MNNMDKITEKLWLGNILAALDINNLTKNGIRKILTLMMEDFTNYSSLGNLFIHKKIKIGDSNLDNIIQYFGECLNFINGDEKVLVHCRAGVSRSATIVVAYLMWDKKMKYSDALDYTVHQRFIAEPNDGFKDQLKIFEKLLIMIFIK